MFHANIIVFVVIIAAGMPPATVSAQSTNCNGELSNGMTLSLKDINLDVRLGYIFGKDEPAARFTINFLNHQTGSIQNHIDYNFIIKDDADKEIFNAASAAGQQSTLHTAEGVITILYEFTDEGYHTIIVTVLDINFVPVEPHTASFPCIPIPEFPVGILGMFAAVVAATLVLTRYKSLTK